MRWAWIDFDDEEKVEEEKAREFMAVLDKMEEGRR